MENIKVSKEQQEMIIAYLLEIGYHVKDRLSI